MRGKGRPRKRGGRARGSPLVSFAVAIVNQHAGTTVTGATSNHLTVAFPDNWVVHGPWLDSADVEANLTIEVV